MSGNVTVNTPIAFGSAKKANRIAMSTATQRKHRDKPQITPTTLMSFRFLFLWSFLSQGFVMGFRLQRRPGCVLNSFRITPISGVRAAKRNDHPEEDVEDGGDKYALEVEPEERKPGKHQIVC